MTPHDKGRLVRESLRRHISVSSIIEGMVRTLPAEPNDNLPKPANPSKAEHIRVNGRLVPVVTIKYADMGGGQLMRLQSASQSTNTNPNGFEI